MLPLLFLHQMFLPVLLLLLQRSVKNVAALEAPADLAEALHERLVLLALAKVLLYYVFSNIPLQFSDSSSCFPPPRCIVSDTSIGLRGITLDLEAPIASTAAPLEVPVNFLFSMISF